jgi:hypothetical protein
LRFFLFFFWRSLYSVSCLFPFPFETFPQTVPDEGDVPPPGGDEATELAFELISALGELGNSLRQLGEGSLSGGIDWGQPSMKGISSLPNSAQKAITASCPSASRLRAFAGSDAFLDVSEYIELFDAPISVHLHSEVTWPHQPSIDFSGMS